MERITVLDAEHATIWYYPDKKVVQNQSKKYVYGAPYREFLNEVTKTIQKYRAQKLLSDDRKNSGISKEDQEWGNKEWFPKTKAAGMQPAALSSQEFPSFR